MRLNYNKQTHGVQNDIELQRTHTWGARMGLIYKHAQATSDNSIKLSQRQSNDVWEKQDNSTVEPQAPVDEPRHMG